MAKPPYFNHEIVAASIPVNQMGSHKGIAFVRWSSPRWCQRAVRRFNGRWLNNKPMFCAVSDYPCKVGVSRRNRQPIEGGIYFFLLAWDLLDGRVHV